MNRANLGERMPAIILGGGVVAGAAGFADTIASTRYGLDLGIRDFLPEPIDAPDHGMSWFMGAALAAHFFAREMERDTPEDFSTAVDGSASTETRHLSVSRLRSKIGAIAAGAIMSGSFYIVAGEVGSEALHAIHNHRQANLPEEEKTHLPLGRFDPLDLAYGIGAAAGYAKLRGKKFNNYVDELETTLPPVRKPAKTRKPSPAASKRYTPPQNRS